MGFFKKKITIEQAGESMGVFALETSMALLRATGEFLYGAGESIVNGSLAQHFRRSIPQAHQEFFYAAHFLADLSVFQHPKWSNKREAILQSIFAYYLMVSIDPRGEVPKFDPGAWAASELFERRILELRSAALHEDRGNQGPLYWVNTALLTNIFGRDDDTLALVLNPILGGIEGRALGAMKKFLDSVNIA